jgi:hypothetical protein
MLSLQLQAITHVNSFLYVLNVVYKLHLLSFISLMELKFNTYHCEGKNQARKTSICISQVLLLEWHMIFFF